MKVNEQAVQDLLDLIDYTPYGTCEALNILYEILPWLEAGNEKMAVEAAVNIEVQRGSLYSIAGHYFQEKFIQPCIRELDHYTNKRAVIEAAIIKAEKEKLYLAEQRHQLLDREEVIAGLLGRWQNMVEAFKYRVRELATMVHGQTVDNNEDILLRFFEDLRREWLTMPEFLHFSAEAQKKFSELLESLEGNQ